MGEEGLIGEAGMEEEGAFAAAVMGKMVVAAVMVAMTPPQQTGGDKLLRAEGGCQNGCQAAWNCTSAAAGHLRRYAPLTAVRSW